MNRIKKIFFSGPGFYFILFILFIILLQIYLRYTSWIIYNSDNASVILQAQSFLQGNPFLHGWITPGDSFITIDIPIYAFFMSFLGFSPMLMQLVPLVIYISCIIVSLFIVTFDLKYNKKYVAGFIAFAIIGYPSIAFLEQALIGPIHMGSVLFALIGILLYILYNKTKKLKFSIIYIILFSFINFLLVIGDPEGLGLLILPVILVLILKLIIKRDYSLFDKRLVLLVAAFFSTFIGILVRSAIYHLGGANILNTVFTFTDVSEILNHTYLTINIVLNLFNANFFNRVLISRTFFPILMHLFVIGLILLAGFSSLRKLRIKHTFDDIEIISILVIIINLSSFILSTFPIDLSSTRYLLPTLMFGGILLGRVIGSINFEKKYAEIFLSVLFLILFSGLFIMQTRNNISPRDSLHKPLIAFLNDHNLTRGYGQYWDANIVTVESRNEVIVRSIIRVDNSMHPNLFLSDESWFNINTRKDINFIILREDSSVEESFLDTVNTFGNPSNTYYIQEFRVLVWDHPLRTDF